ncbi:D-glycero-alpha-D-manno-heptose-1,7-bisphosphate 7-phosphatase [Helicobacter kayseriensis]|uniref:D-glycero-alpha-D-manno-heptose-1,7-bisphosphate 7-phosphatase n=1 Tax=Helicobacter kayseriensis TaxID=2905877 RepID=UPI001E30D61E|nr:HAD family hydrolase [Helicobacter kayseriensis]MCE3046771.1 HAD family hydrolase [Helicobacter kayseriensis]MCE3047927.1 HAD family hydrolase [Helicobacter kayseriensis]
MKKRAVFFDRDGVINIDHGYVYDPKDFEFTSGIFELLSFFKSKDYLLIVVTNQSGIARGYYSIEDFLKLMEFMQNTIKEKLGFAFDKIYFCPHLSGCKCRKPEIGMFKDACMDFQIDLANSIMIGDKETDMQAAQNAGIGKKYFLTLKRPTNLEHIEQLKWAVSLAQIKIFEGGE